MKLSIGMQSMRLKERKDLVHVFGNQFGPFLLVVGDTLEAAMEAWDEAFGRPVESDDPDLKDYGDTLKQALDEAVACGEVRWGPDGPVWVDHYEWVRSFGTVRQAGQWIRSVTSAKLEVAK